MSSANFAQPDITLILDLQGIIQKGALSSVLSDEGIDGWLGRPWSETVGAVGSESVHRMVEDARTSGVSTAHEVTQHFPSGLELAIEYTTLRLGGNAGFIAIGRNLQAVEEIRTELIAAQQAMEQDYWKLREVETRYRLLFDTSKEPVLSMGVDDLRIAESNPAARRALGVRPGQELPPRLSAQEWARLDAMLSVVRAHGTAPSIVVQIGPDRKRWLVRASLIKSPEQDAAFLLRFSPAVVARPQRHGDSITAEDLFERLSDGFVLIDQDGVVLRANQPFRDLIQPSTGDAVVGERLGRWLKRPGADMSVLLANLHRDGAVGLFATTIWSDSGLPVEVEISAAGNLTTTPKFIGVLLSRRKSTDDDRARLAALSPAVESIDKASLRKLIQNTITDIERECIEAARDQSEADRAGSTENGGSNEFDGGRENPYGKLH